MNITPEILAAHAKANAEVYVDLDDFTKGWKAAQAHFEPTELALCEAERLVLRQGQHYVFKAIPGCSRCDELSVFYKDAA